MLKMNARFASGHERPDIVRVSERKHGKDEQGRDKTAVYCDSPSCRHTIFGLKKWINSYVIDEYELKLYDTKNIPVEDDHGKHYHSDCPRIKYTEIDE